MTKVQINKIALRAKGSKEPGATHPLQTSFWGKFRKEWGNEVLYTKHGLLTLHKIPPGPEALWGRWPFTKHKIGMFIKGPKPTVSMIKELKKLGTKEGLVFIKLEPNFAVRLRTTDYGNNNAKREKRNAKTKKLFKLLKNHGAVPGKTLFTPTTFQIDLAKSEDELMKSFSSKTRYNIRLAKRKGVEVVEDNSKKAFDKYIELTKETVERQGFYAHTEKYHRLMWRHLNSQLATRNSQPIARLLTARYKGDVITTWILFVWKDVLYYPYGASSTKHKNVMANNLMMWEAIQLGKKLGLKTFDLWGREPGKGFTKFKEGYSPSIVEFLGTWDLVINKPLYYLYRLAESARWSLLRTKAKLGLSKASF